MMSDFDLERLEERLRAAAGPLTGGDPPDLGPALESSGYADVIYVVESSPLGELLLGATERGLVCLHYVQGEEDVELVLERIAARLTPRIVAGARGGPGGRGSRRLEPARRELDEFFSGRRRDFDLALDWSLVKGGFTRAVLRETARIPFGQTISYTGIAGRAGNERAFRAAGTALGSNPLPIVIPCHRVLHSGGGLGGYAGGLDVKRRLLAIEGVGAGSGRVYVSRRRIGAGPQTPEASDDPAAAGPAHQDPPLTFDQVRNSES